MIELTSTNATCKARPSAFDSVSSVLGTSLENSLSNVMKQITNTHLVNKNEGRL